MHVGCKCNVIATCPQCYLESTFLRYHNVVITTLSQPKDNVVTTLSQRDFVCWVHIAVTKEQHFVELLYALSKYALFQFSVPCADKTCDRQNTCTNMDRECVCKDGLMFDATKDTCLGEA